MLTKAVVKKTTRQPSAGSHSTVEEGNSPNPARARTRGLEANASESQMKLLSNYLQGCEDGLEISNIASNGTSVVRRSNMS